MILFKKFFFFLQITSNLTKLEFNALDISENNYLSWILDVEIQIEAMNLGDTIKENNTSL
jgi:hypothetical protein